MCVQPPLFGESNLWGIVLRSGSAGMLHFMELKHLKGLTCEGMLQLMAISSM